MSVVIERRASTLYEGEGADLVLYISGGKAEIERLWDALHGNSSWEVLTGVDGRVVLKPTVMKGRRRMIVVN